MTKNQHSQPNLSILVLGTGGTIAGLGGDAYLAGQLPIHAIVPATGYAITSEQVAQIDSKDMSFEVWGKLYLRLLRAMQDEAIGAVVITHGTDTLEETAYFLHRTVACTKPVILTAAMRPADSSAADGPSNLRQSFGNAQTLSAGVWVVMAGQVMGAVGLQKMHPHALDAFVVHEPSDATLGQAANHPVHLKLPLAQWPRVEIVMNYAGSTDALVRALIQQKVDGIVVAATGNGALSTALEGALHKACEAGIAVRLTTRCLQGTIQPNVHHTLPISQLSPVQARVELMLELITPAQQSSQSQRMRP